LIQINNLKGRVSFNFSWDRSRSQEYDAMFSKTVIALATAVMLGTAFVPTEASAWYGAWYGRSWGYPYGHCRGYFYSGGYTYQGYFPYAGCDPLKSD
jgi:hypothetical protein